MMIRGSTVLKRRSIGHHFIHAMVLYTELSRHLLWANSYSVILRWEILINGTTLLNEWQYEVTQCVLPRPIIRPNVAEESNTSIYILMIKSTLNWLFKQYLCEELMF